MRGFWKMLSGRGEHENRKAHQALRDAIPETFPADWTEEQRMDHHPMYSGPGANTIEAANYRRANACHGPKSKREHRAMTEEQELRARYDKLVGQYRGGGRVLSFDEWLMENGY